MTGRAKAWSDLVLAIVSDREVPLLTLAELKDELRESDLPIRVDVAEWRNLPQAVRRSPYMRLERRKRHLAP